VYGIAHPLGDICLFDESIQRRAGNDLIPACQFVYASEKVRKTCDQPKYRKYESINVSASSRGGRQPRRCCEEWAGWTEEKGNVLGPAVRVGEPRPE
jgi:hypothetical protein